MPSTTPYGFEYEQTTEAEPTRTLNGGSAGLSPILAEQVNDEIARVDQDIQDVSDAAAAAALGWVPIGGGSIDAVSDWVIDATAGGTYPAGTFSMMRLHLRGSMDTSAQYLTVNINDSLTSGSHKRGYYDITSDGVVTAGPEDDSVTWRVGFWGSALIGNTCTVELFETDISSFVSFRSESEQQSGASSTHRKMISWGRLNENRLVSSIRVGRVGSDNYGPTRWWLEGYRDA